MAKQIKEQSECIYIYIQIGISELEMTKVFLKLKKK